VTSNRHRPILRRVSSVLAVVLAFTLAILVVQIASAAPPTRPDRPLRPPVLGTQDLADGGEHRSVVPTGAVGKALTTDAAKPATASGAGVRKTTAGAAATEAVAATSASTLVLYDTTGNWGWLGEMYATMTANLTSQFGSWTAKPVSAYAAGDVNRYTATIYVGSTYDEPLPTSFLDDVVATSRPVIWMYDNIWQLTARHPTFQDTYGWMWSQFDTSAVNTVAYKGRELSRDPTNQAGVMNYASVGSGVQVLANAKRTDGSTFPWALRSRNLTYIGEIPFVYFSEGDRMMAFSDLLFDALDPARAERHRALVRLEDISADSDPAELRAAADYLASKGVPFSFGVSPRYLDPLGFYNGGRSQTIRLDQSRPVVDAIKYLQSKGGVMLEHGWTHQYSNIANPYDGVTGDDFEFYRVVENADHTLTWVGPVTQDSPTWNRSRIDGAAADFRRAGLTTPTIFEFPHYSGSATAYREVAKVFGTRYERSLYFRGVLTGGAVDHSRMVGQFFPYVVRDVYGTKVLPENVGNVEPEDWFQYPKRLPAQIIADAQRNLVVRDGFASFYFHPFFDISYLKQTVEGIQAAGYTFVSPTGL
jgi:uncharacterized protein YdaL